MQYIQAKSILSKIRTKDPYFGISYSMNLYRGCQHACIYCDTRSECYGINDISKISVKSNALELLAKELRSKRKNRATIGTGSMNDPYMPIEKELELIRSALQIIASEKFPVHIVTKSSLATRDSDVLQEIAKIYAAVSFTITTYNDGLAKRLEPAAPKSSDRFEAMKHLASLGIYTGVTLMPILPFINDTKENVENILKKAKDSGASYIIAMFGVTLRKGSREYFYSRHLRKIDYSKKVYLCVMLYKDIENLKSTHFKRLTGVKREVFMQMLDVINESKSLQRKHPRRGTPAKLSNADKLLLLLMYYMEYRTQFHIGVTYGISESRVCEIIKETESILIKDSRFHLPGKKSLLKGENHFEVLLIDVTESPVERPKKNSD